MSHDEISTFSVLVVCLFHLGVESSSFLDCRRLFLLMRTKPELLIETFIFGGIFPDEVVEISSDYNVQIPLMTFEDFLELNHMIHEIWDLFFSPQPRREMETDEQKDVSFYFSKHHKGRLIIVVIEPAFGERYLIG